MKFQFLSLVLLGSFLRVGAMNVDVTEANIVLESKNFDRELEHNDISIEEEENNREVMIHNEEDDRMFLASKHSFDLGKLLTEKDVIDNVIKDFHILIPLWIPKELVRIILEYAVDFSTEDEIGYSLFGIKYGLRTYCSSVMCSQRILGAKVFFCKEDLPLCVEFNNCYHPKASFGRLNKDFKFIDGKIVGKTGKWSKEKKLGGDLIRDY